MAFNINDLRSRIAAKGLQRNNRFLVRFYLPLGLQGNPNAAKFQSTTKDLEFWSESASIPGVALSINPVTRYGYGPMEKKPATAVFTDMNFSIICDGNTDNWTFFQQWFRIINNYDNRNGIRLGQGQANINNSQTTTQAFGAIVNGNAIEPFELSYKYEYITDVNVIAFDETGKPSFNIILKEAFPVFLGEVPMNWSDNNTIMRFPISFTFQTWYNNNQT